MRAAGRVDDVNEGFKLERFVQLHRPVEVAVKGGHIQVASLVRAGTGVFVALEATLEDRAAVQDEYTGAGRKGGQHGGTEGKE